MTSVLVTGATTPLGCALITELLGRDDTRHVVAVGIEEDGVRCLGRLATDPRLRYERVDLTRSRALRTLLLGPVRDLGIRAVAHLALHRSAQAHGRRVRQLNVECTRELMLLAEQHPTIERFVLRSHAEVYDVEADRPVLIGEDHPLNLRPTAPQWVRDRVEADLTVCAHMGLSSLSIAVLRSAECLAPDSASQLHDYLESRVCFVAAGFDPMLNLITVEDLAHALALALESDAEGVFTIPGRDTLPLSEVISRWGRVAVPVFGPLMTPLYWLRTRATGGEFRYDLNRWRFHFSGVLDGRRAREVLGYEPTHAIRWPRPRPRE